jgi:hypothetical protein
MRPERSSKFSAVNLMVLGQEEGQDLGFGSVFGQILIREEFRIGGRHLGIGMYEYIRRPFKRRMYTSDSMGNYEEEVEWD